MTYIIAEPCIDIRDRSCVVVCPADCIHEFERFLIIGPEKCIDWKARRRRTSRATAARLERRLP
jgi:NAD-dependent dihydropyrimidine dehydrogenase PreA subunit